MGVGIAIQLKFSGEWEWELSGFLDQLLISEKTEIFEIFLNSILFKKVGELMVN